MNVFANPNSRAFARVAGIFYLLIAVSGGYAIAYAPTVWHLPGDPMGTLNAIRDNATTFLSGLAGDVVMMSSEVMVTALLYFMFRNVNPTLSLAAALARFAMVAVMAAMMLFHAGIFAIAQNSLPLGSMTPDMAAEVAYLLLHMHDAGVWVSQVFFTIHLLLLGWLLLASGLYPRLLGIGLMVGGAGYLLDSVYAFAFPDFAALGITRAALLAVVTLSEVGFALWLVFVGPRLPETGGNSTPRSA